MDKTSQINQIDNDIVIKSYITRQMDINRKAYEVYLERERELFKQVLETFKTDVTHK